uniref:Uncharacterized protein n=1 Tax=Arundo donax TaxID=35708 RepID=A0A0A9GU28_ARUDO
MIRLLCVDFFLDMKVGYSWYFF